MTRKEARSLVATAEREGGFTYDCESHSHPTRGFAFSERHDAEHKVRTLTARAIRAYVAAHAADLRAPGAHLGAWRDGSVWYLDVSRVEGDLETARALAKMAAQLALFDLELREIAWL